MEMHISMERERERISNLMIHLKELEKKINQVNPKVLKGKKNNIKVEINEIEMNRCKASTKKGIVSLKRNNKITQSN